MRKTSKRLVFLVTTLVVLAARPASAKDPLDALADGTAETGAYSLVLRESGASRRRVVELDADGTWRRSESKTICRETWEARCWQEQRMAGRLSADEKAKWIRAGAKLVRVPAAPALPGSDTLSVAIRRGETIVGQATGDAAALGAKAFAPLLNERGK